MHTDFLAKVSNALGSAQNVEQLARPLLELLELVTGLESTYLTRIDLAASVQTIIFSRNSKALQIPEGLSVPWDDTLCKRALEEGRNYTDDVAACWGDSDAARMLGLNTYASTPVYLEDGDLYGTLCAASSNKKPITVEGKHVLSLFSSLFSVYIQREVLLERLQKANANLSVETVTDTLTGLPNRRFVISEMHRIFSLARRNRQLVLVAFIDLDDFKKINDTYGHEVGDQFLIEVGKRLSTGLRTEDMLGRLGGDEFIMVGLAGGEGADAEATAEAMRKRLTPLVQGRFTFDQCAFDYPGASIGVFAANPEIVTPAEALRAADMLMYAVKKERIEKKNAPPRK